MADEAPVDPELQEIQSAFDGGRFDEARRRLADLPDTARAELETELGAGAVERLTRAAARGVRRSKVGRVVVINGIMGALLDRRYKNGRMQRIWIDYWRLFNGHLRHLRMGLDGGPADPDIEIRVGGLHKSYWQLVLELDGAWHVLQHPFDWRLDIDKSAQRLAQTIHGWAGGEPAHIVAHSMGGLVARRMVRNHPDVWAAMDDPDGRRRGGRLVMLGTPNKGSFAIPLTLTGEEKAVRRLAKLDRKHGRKAVQSIISTFHGPYQMLPSPEVDLGDDHRQLFGSGAWGAVPHHPDLLALGERFQREMDEVLSPERLIYVAGYDYETPGAIRVDSPGSFSYRPTFDGDGRVPHRLGLLDGVPTYWVREVHGKLPESEHVLEDVHELLARGTVHALLTSKPARRALPEEREWRSPYELEADPIDLGPFLGSGEPRSADEAERRSAGPPNGQDETPPDRRRQAVAEALVTGGWVGAETPEAATRGFGSPKSKAAAMRRTVGPLKLKVEVLWGDIRRVESDVYCVGHYNGVLPARAEKALDEVVSGLWRRHESEEGPWVGVSKSSLDQDARVLHSLTQQGLIRGNLGDISFFPWSWRSIAALRGLSDDAGRTAGESGESSGVGVPVVAVAGMGYPGAFDEAKLRRLAGSLAWSIALLPDVTTVATVLIGSGDGGLSVKEALRGLLAGMRDSLVGGVLGTGVTVRKLRIAELFLDRAYDILEALEELQEENPEELELTLSRDFDERRGGWLTDEHCLSMVLGAARRSQHRDAENAALLGLVRDHLPRASDERLERVLGAISKLEQPELAEGEDEEESWERFINRLEVRRKDGSSGWDIPTRMSFVREQNAIKIAAIQKSAVVPERTEKLDLALIEELNRRLTDPTVDELAEHAGRLYTLLIPRDFREQIDFNQTMVFEVDRSMANVPYEMLPRGGRQTDRPYLALRTPISRQLRTGYSPPPAPVPQSYGRALVIGDPGDPAKGHDLPGAREEARRAVEILEAKGMKVDALIGVPIGRGRLGDEPGYRPATRLDVLGLLSEHDYDLLHYCGHGDFDPDDPTRAGWLFKDGLLTANELERLDRVPQLVVANACLTSKLSNRLAGREGAAREHGEVGLLPTLADEFFRRGVFNYLGTAWEVSDRGAVLFMQVFYDRLLPDVGDAATADTGFFVDDELDEGRGGLAIGEALLSARKALWRQRGTFGCLWAAYQHYGDPTLTLKLPERRAD